MAFKPRYGTRAPANAGDPLLLTPNSAQGVTIDNGREMTDGVGGGRGVGAGGSMNLLPFQRMNGNTAQGVALLNLPQASLVWPGRTLHRTTERRSPKGTIQ